MLKRSKTYIICDICDICDENKLSYKLMDASSRLQAADQEPEGPGIEGLEERHLHHQTSARFS